MKTLKIAFEIYWPSNCLFFILYSLLNTQIILMAFQISREIVCVKKYQKESSFFRENLGLGMKEKWFSLKAWFDLIFQLDRFLSKQSDLWTYCEIRNKRNSEFAVESSEQLIKHVPMRYGKIGCGVSSLWIFFLKIFA